MPTYEPSNELSQGFTASSVNNVRAATMLKCEETACTSLKNRWTHVTTVWSGSDGLLTIYIDGLNIWEGAGGAELKRDMVLGGRD